MEHPQTARWPIRLGRKSKPVLLLFGARESNSYVDLDEQLEAHFGLYRISTPVANIARWRIEGPWSWFTAIGVRRGIRDGVASFGGNHVESVRLDFKDRVRWLRVLRTPALYVTVTDLESFTQALAARGIPGEDARKK
jgi:hypothetical protein